MDCSRRPAPEPEKLELTLGKIRGLVGEKNVGYPELFDTHRPGSGRTDWDLLPFRYFRPPLEARVTADRLWTRMFQGQILQIARTLAIERRLVEIRIMESRRIRSGAERWRAVPHYLDRAPEKWFVEGVYD